MARLECGVHFARCPRSNFEFSYFAFILIRFTQSLPVFPFIPEKLLDLLVIFSHLCFSTNQF